MKAKTLLPLFVMAAASCNIPSAEKSVENEPQVDYYAVNEADQWSGGVRMIPIETAHGTFHVWTKRVGNNPTKKVLLLHGGPGANNQYFEAADSYFPGESIEYYYYDQLGAGNSENPQYEDLWSIDHYVEEVEQVRVALGLNAENFILLGHSWGGILAIEYALKYQANLKGLIISNMVPSAPEYNQYANTILAAQMDPDILAQLRAFEAAGEYTHETYLKLITENYYPAHVLRRPLDAWPEPVNRSFASLNYPMYLHMQGPSEFGIVGNATLKDWDRKSDLSKITVPTLSIGAQYDTMDPAQMEWMASEVQNGRYLYCAEGSHMAMYDDQKTYFEGVVAFIQGL